jgi:hypothetical protein
VGEGATVVRLVREHLSEHDLERAGHSWCSYSRPDLRPNDTSRPRLVHRWSSAVSAPGSGPQASARADPANLRKAGPNGPSRIEVETAEPPRTRGVATKTGHPSGVTRRKLRGPIPIVGRLDGTYVGTEVLDSHMKDDQPMASLAEHAQLPTEHVHERIDAASSFTRPEAARTTRARNVR